MDVVSNTSTYEDKIKMVLKKLLDPSFEIKDDIYLDSLLTHIKKRQEQSKQLTANDTVNNTFSCWIMQATKIWERSKQKVSPKVLCFALGLASFISKDESIFVKFNSVNTYERLLNIMNVNSSPPTIKLRLITLLSSFLVHKSGLQWIIATNYWKNIITLTLDSHTIYITSAGCKFIAELLDKTIYLNETFCQHVVETLTSPLDVTTADPDDKTNNLDVRKKAVPERLLPVLKVIADVIKLLLDCTNLAISDLLLNSCKLRCEIRNLLRISESEDFLFELRKITYLLGLIEVYQTFVGFDKIMYRYVPDTRKGIMEAFRFLIEKGHAKSVVKLCYMGHVYWKSIGQKMPLFFEGDHQITHENQLIIMQNVPILLIGPGLHGFNELQHIDKTDTVRDDYITKTIQISGTRTMYAAYQWRNFLKKYPNLLDIARMSLIYVMKSKPFYTREGAVMIFQALVYSLQDITAHVKESPPHMQHPLNKFLELLLEAIGMFIEEFNITWKESIESMSVMVLAVELLHINVWTPKMVVKALNLLKITVSKYMSPSMVLLMEPAHDSSLTSVGTLLYAKCNDPNWEVRDSSLEVLCTMSYNANTRFPSLQRIVLDAELPHLVVNMAIKDVEPYVRMSAVRCLQEMIKVQEFWENLMKIEYLYETFFDIAVKETEGIVRQEAATLMCKIYDHQYYPETLLPKLYDIMTHAVVADLHWEVKLNALNFWQSVVKMRLQSQGMIDGTFPKVTFSKETHKIVNLNDMEIKKRLLTVLNELSEIGCLAVFVTAIQDDCDVRVVEAATQIASEFVDLLQRYEITDQNSNLSHPPIPLVNVPLLSNKKTLSASSQDSPLSDEATSCSSNIIEIAYKNCLSSSTEMEYEDENFSTRAVDVTDDILDEVLNCSDTKVLKTLYSPNDNVYSENVSTRKISVLPVSEFIKFTCGNLRSNLSEKNKWLNQIDDFGSLLDDILEDYDNPDVNNPDCY